MDKHHITDAEYTSALEAGRKEAGTQFRAQSVRYVADRDALEIVTNRNAGFLIPRQWIGALQDVKLENLAQLEVWPDGSAIELENQNIQISVHGLLSATLPGLVSTQTLAAIFASRGGSSSSESKRSAARLNGRKGGRPRKTA